MRYRALGCHVFAGGFTMGVRHVMDVRAQLEIFDLGQKTVQAMGLEYARGTDWREWLDRRDLYENVHFLFGNPRCTAFSCMTAGYSEEAHGAWAKQTKDVHDLCNFGVEVGFPVICWESVQQAYTVGKELLDYLRDTLFQPNGYRVAHVFVNAASFGNAQHRKRYFFFAYKDDKNFNVVPPELPDRHATVGDVICTDELMKIEAEEFDFGKRVNYVGCSCRRMKSKVRAIVEFMPMRCGLTGMAKRHLDVLEEFSPELARKWHERESNMPYSMHDAYRLDDEWVMPTIAGSCHRFIHPLIDRHLTVHELSILMGWPKDPIGPLPFAQLAKGIVPVVGTWLAEQVIAYLNDDWGDEDWDSRYCNKTNRWIGNDYAGHAIKPPEKVFNLTRWCPEKPT